MNVRLDGRIIFLLKKAWMQKQRSTLEKLIRCSLCSNAKKGHKLYTLFSGIIVDGRMK